MLFLQTEQCGLGGPGASGQLGDGTNVTSRKLPAKVKDPSGTGVLSNVTAIAGGHNASAYALLSDGKVVSWGKKRSRTAWK